jgi:hypothetical protein
MRPTDWPKKINKRNFLVDNVISLYGWKPLIAITLRQRKNDNKNVNHLFT